MRPSAAPIRTILSVFLTAVFFLPLYVVLTNVFKPGSQISDNPLALAWPPSLDNIKTVLNRPDKLFWYGLVNSVEITAISATILVILSAMLAHYLARKKGWWPKLVLLVLVCGLTIPTAVIMGALTRMLNSFGLIGTVGGLILVNVGYYLPFGVFVFMGFIKSIPMDTEEAAALDGAGPFRTFFQVVFPLLRPATASVFIFLSVWVWNDFLTPLIVMGPTSGTTVTVGIYRAIGEHATDFGSIFAFMFLASLPLIVCYLAFQRHFVKGLTSGATKG